MKRKTAGWMAAAIAAAFAVPCTAAGGYKAEPAWETRAEFKNPESAVYDSKRDVLYVSNVNGDATAKDGNGFISRLAPDGTITTLEWVSGLNGPKGLAIVGDRLYAADIDALVEIDLNEGKVTRRYEAPGARFLNDVATDQAGNVYVSDMFTDKIHRLHKGRFAVWLQSEALQNPNGLIVAGPWMYVGAWGVIVEGFKTDVPGHIKIVSLRDKSITDLGDGHPIGNMDGIELLPDGTLLATDWMAGSLMTVSQAGDAVALLDLNQGSADLDYIPGKKLAVIPMMNDGKVVAYRLSRD